MSDILNLNRVNKSWNDYNNSLEDLQDSPRDNFVSIFDESRISQLEKLNHYIINAVEQERARLSIKVHDELGQLLTALKFGLHKLISADSTEKNLSIEVMSLIASTNEIVHKVQHISQEMHPVILQRLGLNDAIDWYCKDFETRTGICCYTNLKAGVKSRIDQSTELSLYRVLQEALTNIIRHSNATKVYVNYQNQRSRIILSIEDNGVGMPMEKLNSCESMGLISMQQRIRNSGGEIHFENCKNSGLKVTIVI